MSWIILTRIEGKIEAIENEDRTTAEFKTCEEADFYASEIAKVVPMDYDLIEVSI